MAAPIPARDPAKEGNVHPSLVSLWRAEAARAADQVLDLLFPRSCVACEDPVDAASGYRFICASCSRLLTIVRAPACKTCGYPFFGVVGSERSCPHCQELSPLFGEAKTAVLMKGPARQLVHEFKYHGHVHLMEDMGRIMRRCEGLLDFAAGAVLVPVPLHPRKRRQRGFNQSLLLARRLAELAPGAEVIEALERLKDTESQTRFDRARRQRNLKNAFAMRTDSGLNPRVRCVVVDDVFTTGSTLNACAAVLRRNGCRQIDVVTFGHG